MGDLLRRGLVQSEDDFTVRLVDRIEQRIDGLSTSGVTWRAVKLTDRGQGAQEAEVGADLLGILTVRSPYGEYSKGFLAQAKLIRKGGRIKRPELAAQADDMLRWTPDSFIFLYHRSGVHVASALPIARTTAHPLSVPLWRLHQFFDAHLRSFVGEERLGITGDAPVEVMRREFRAKFALSIEALIDEEHFAERTASWPGE